MEQPIHSRQDDLNWLRALGMRATDVIGNAWFSNDKLSYLGASDLEASLLNHDTRGAVIQIFAANGVEELVMNALIAKLEQRNAGDRYPLSFVRLRLQWGRRASLWPATCGGGCRTTSRASFSSYEAGLSYERLFCLPCLYKRSRYGAKRRRCIPSSVPRPRWPARTAP
jgi:hypothetical protein